MNTAAPGKLFVVGEYAVLENVPAVLVPVPIAARASFETAGDPTVTIRTYQRRVWPLEEALAANPLLSAIAEELDLTAVLSTGSLVLDTRQFFEGTTKLGFGSSAAITAAMMKLFRPDLDTREQLVLAQACHRRFQGGVGSGADIALALAGEPIVFQVPYDIEPITLPADLKILAIWTGKAASTPDLLRAMTSWRQNHEDTYQQLMRILSLAAGTFTAAARSDETARCLSAIGDYGQALRDLSDCSGLHFYDDNHVALQKKVELTGCVYKPSGAGGGDFGIACGLDEEITLLAEQMADEGHLTVPVL